MKYSSDTDGNRTCGFRLVTQCLNQMRHHMPHDHPCGTVPISYDVFGRKKEVGVNQKCPVGTLYKSRIYHQYFLQIHNVTSVLRTNKNNSSDAADIKDVQNKINI